MKLVKPPIALKPEINHLEDRREDIRDAIARQNELGEEIPAEWFLELHFLAARIAVLKARQNESEPKKYHFESFREQ